MATWTSVIRFVPDPIAGECINIGVIVFDEDNARLWFLDDWHRVKDFGRMSENDSFFHEFEKEFRNSFQDGTLYPEKTLANASNYDLMMKLSKDWQNTIQITQPSGSISTLGLEKDLFVAVSIYLKEFPRVSYP